MKNAMEIYPKDLYQFSKKVNEKPLALITPETKQKFDLYIECCDNEISGLGSVSMLGRNRFLLDDIFLFAQDVHALGTKLSSQAIAMFAMEQMEQGDDLSNLHCWWHSHVHMKTEWSLIDEATIERLGNDWMLSVVGNKHKEYNVRLDIFKPLRLTLHDIELQVYVPPPNDSLRKEIEKEIGKKITAVNPKHRFNGPSEILDQGNTPVSQRVRRIKK